MDLGIFLPIASNGFIASRASPQFMPSWALNRDVTQKCEDLGFEFALSMIKFRGFQGDTGYWQYAHESFTLMAALAAATKRIELYASVATLTFHPAVAARIAMTIDDISGGRFGVNIVSGWYKSEYAQMGLWRGDEFYDRRYDYATEYVQVLRELWATGRSDFKGEFFTLEDCECFPLPQRRLPIVCAGQSGRGLRFTAEMGDRNFVIGEIETLQKISQDLSDAAIAAGRGGQVGTIALFNVIAAPTDQEAKARYERFVAEPDVAAIKTMTGEATMDHSEGMVRWLVERAMFMGLPTLIGSYDYVAQYLDRVAAETPVGAVMLALPDFVEDLDRFGKYILPNMQCRAGKPGGPPLR